MDVAELWGPPFELTPEGKFETREQRLHITIVNGCSSDALHLLEGLRAAGLSCPFAHLHLQRAGLEPFGALEEAPARPSAHRNSASSTALLFEAEGELTAARQCANVLRTSTYFGATPLLLAVSEEQLADLDAATEFDDFVRHPCPAAELRARLGALARRRAGSAGSARAEPDGIVVDPMAREVQVGGGTVSLTARELALLECLRARRGRILSREQLLSQVWGHRYRGGRRTVDTHIGRLRAKFGAWLPIETVRANGYRLRAPQPLGPSEAGQSDGAAQPSCCAAAGSRGRS